MMDNQEILDNAPEGTLGIKIMDGFYRWVLKDNTQSKIYDCEEFNGYNQIYRSLEDIKRIAELEKERDVLAEFTMWTLDVVISGSDVNAEDAQDKMFDLGILTREIYNPDVHTLNQGSECEPGDYIYFKALKGQGDE